MCNKEEPHTNIKDSPKQLAKLNVCIDNSLICQVVMSVAYFDSVDFPSKDSFLYNRHSIRWLQIACLTYLVVKGNYSNHLAS